MAFKQFMQHLTNPDTPETELQTIVIALMGGSASGKTSFFQGIMESMVHKSVRLGSGETLLLEPIKVSRGVSPETESGEVNEEVLLTAPAGADASDSESLFSQMMHYANGFPASESAIPETKEKNADQVAARDLEAASEQDQLAESLKLADQLRKMFTINPDDGFQAPTATVRYVEITFRVTVNDEPKCLLTITDYAGELLDNASADFNSRMVDILSRFIRRSDAVIMLANARNFTGLLEETYSPEQCMFKEQAARRDLSADNICAVVRSMRVEGYTILLALTQTDSPQIDEKISRSHFSRAQRDLRNYIYEIAFSTAAARHWSYGSIPVTVVGRKRDGSPNVDEFNNLLPDAVLRQENVDTSVLFCLYNAVMRRIMELQKEKAELEQPVRLRSSDVKKRIAAKNAEIRTLGELRSALSGRPELYENVFDPDFALEVVSETGEVRVTRSAGKKR
ncbi:MAG: hypothetical protein II916_03625 [Oscillospiraceae bacterium]|nr:hypothetical protein [Oscillospiraceae bacterium]